MTALELKNHLKWIKDSVWIIHKHYWKECVCDSMILEAEGFPVCKERRVSDAILHAWKYDEYSIEEPAQTLGIVENPELERLKNFYINIACVNKHFKNMSHLAWVTRLITSTLKKHLPEGEDLPDVDFFYVAGDEEYELCYV
jgi:hypothetical protein